MLYRANTSEFPVKIRRLSVEEEICIGISAGQTIAQVKELVASSSGLKSNKFVLEFNGIELEDANLLIHESGLHPGCEIYLRMI